MATLNHPDLVDLILATVDKILHMEKGQVLEAEGVKLHPSEIHLLLFLNSRPQANATEIADRFSVTKGAVSQTLSRLETKGVLAKNRNPETPTELALAFTELGKSLMVHVLQLKETAARRFDSHLSAMSEEEREAVGHFFLRLIAGFEGKH